MALVLAGCGGEEVPGGASHATDPWHADVVRASELPDLSEVQRSALADGSIDRGEYESAKDDLVRCVGAGGVHVIAHSSTRGLFTFEVTPGTEQANEVYTRCSSPQVNPVNYLYPSVLANPRKEDFPRLLLECLTVRNLIDQDASYSSEAAALEAAAAVDDTKATECLEEPLAFTSGGGSEGEIQGG